MFWLSSEKKSANSDNYFDYGNEKNENVLDYWYRK